MFVAGGFTGRGRARRFDHRLAQHPFDADGHAVQLVAGLQLAVHPLGEVVKSGQVILRVAHNENVIACMH